MAIYVWDRHKRTRHPAQSVNIRSVYIDRYSEYEAEAFIGLGSCIGGVVINGTTLHNLIRETLKQNSWFRDVIRHYCDLLDAEEAKND